MNDWAASRGDHWANILSSMAERVRVLSIDGGGTRGVIPNLVLEKLEKETGKPTCELFDLIAGTSAGGLLALGLSAPDREGRPLNTAHEMIGIAEGTAPTIFHKSRAHIIRAAGGLLANKYDPAGLEESAKKMVGDTMLSAALTDVMVACYAIEARKPVFFKSAKAERDEYFDLPMWLCARAATSAPTFFPPTKVEIGDQGDYLAVIDGGVFLNNPAVSAYAEARKMYPDAEIYVLSLGTGQTTKRIHYEEARDWGLAHWARPILDITNDGGSQAIDYQLQHLLGDDHYLRLNPLLGGEHDHLDAATKEHQRTVRLVAERQVKSHKDKLSRWCEILTAD